MGVSSCGFLVLLFIILKLTGVIHLGWLWLVLPTLSGMIITALVVVIAVIVLAIRD